MAIFTDPLKAIILVTFWFVTLSSSSFVDTHGNNIITYGGGSVTASPRRSAPASYCDNPNNKGDGLRWTKAMGDTQFVYEYEFSQLWCCAAGFQTITWKMRPTNSSSWLSVNSATQGVIIKQTGRQLLIQKFASSDEGTYECMAEDAQGKKITHQYWVKMEVPASDCGPGKNGPVFAPPLHQNNSVIIKQPGQNLTLRCLVSFGKPCGGFRDILISVQWYGVRNGTCSEMITDPTEKWKSSESGHLLMQRVITITNISESDYNRQWCCRVNVDNSKTFFDKVIGLHAPLKPATRLQDAPFDVKLTVSIIAAVVGVTFIVLVLLWFFRLEILLLHHVKFGRRRNNAGDFGFLYDVMLVYSDSDHDRRFVRDILRPKLEECWHYRVFLPERDLEPGYIDEAYIQALRESRKIVLFITEDYLTNALYRQIHDYIIDERRNVDVIYLQYHSIAEELWSVENNHVLRGFMKTAGRRWLGLGKRLKWRDNFDVVNENDGRIVSAENMHRQINKLWRQFSLYLPPPPNDPADRHNDSAAEYIDPAARNNGLAVIV